MRPPLLQCSDSLLCGFSTTDGAVVVEFHAVDAHLAMETGAEVAINEIGIDAVIDEIPFVATGNLQHAVVGRAVDLLVGFLDEDDGLVGNLDGSER